METTRLVRRALITVCAIALAACSSSSGLPSDPPLVSPSTALASPGQTAQPTPSQLLSVSPSSSPALAVLDGEPWIAYQGGTGGPARVRLVRPDGTGDHELTPGDVPGEQFHPDWSHDGRRVAFAVDDTDGTRDIWAANVDGGDVRQLYDCDAPCGWTDAPAWSPDDKEIAFEHGFLVEEATGEGDSSVEVLDLATGTSRPVYDAAATEYVYTPRWSPDGRWIVFELDRFDSPRLDAETVLASTLAIADVTGAAEPRLLLPWDSWATSPDWHPVADQIAYAAPTKAGQDPADIYTVGLDGHDPVRVTDFGSTGGWGIQPAWTPDGERIIFVGEDVVRTKPNAASIRPDATGLERMPWDGTFRTHPRLRPTS